jgi:hypothetical protein
MKMKEIMTYYNISYAMKKEIMDSMPCYVEASLYGPACASACSTMLSIVMHYSHIYTCG